MRHLKLVVPTLALVALVLALAGTASATGTATVICKKSKTDPCLNPVEAGTELHTAATNLALNTNSGNFKCTSSNMGIKPNETSGEPLKIEITNLSFSGCQNPVGVGCEMVTSAPYKAQLQATSEFNGVLTVTPESFGWHMTCGSQWNCSMSASSAQLFWQSGTSGVPSQLVAHNLVLTGRSGLCPPKAIELNANWVIEPGPVPFYVSHL